MISRENITYSLKNLKQKKSRSFLTIFSIFIGIATIFIFVSFGIGLYSYVNTFATQSSADKITIQTKGTGAPGLDQTFKLTKDDLTAVRKTPGVYEALGLRMKTAEIIHHNTKKYSFLISYNQKSTLMKELSGISIHSGRELTKSDKGKVVLGYNYLVKDRIFPNALSLNDKITIQGKELRVVGFLEPAGNPHDDSQAYINEEFFLDLYPNETEDYNWIISKVDVSNLDKVVLDIEDNLRKSRNLEKGKEDFFVASFNDLLKSYMDALNIIVGFVVLIALISVFVSAINTANTMATSHLERVKEIGVMKAIGAKNSDIFNIFLLESSFLGFIAGTIGVAAGWIFTSIAKIILSNFGWTFLNPYYSFGLFFGCILFATITGAISGVFPALKASRVNPADSLRYE